MIYKYLDASRYQGKIDWDAAVSYTHLTLPTIA